MAHSLSTSQSSDRDAYPDVLPASQYLQERLQERRTRNPRPKRLRQSDFGPRSGRDDDIFTQAGETAANATTRMYDSSPLATGRLGLGVGDSDQRRDRGMKSYNEQMDRLTKENFALKLELDHRRQHTAKLQEQLNAMRSYIERADKLHEEHAELLKINSQLVDELEKRDKAVEEAMDIICDLEDKVADVGERSPHTRPSTANPDSGYAGTETQEQAPAVSPPDVKKSERPAGRSQSRPTNAASAASERLLNAVGAPTSSRVRREPLVLSDKRQSTHALRSVYLESTHSLHPVKSFNSLLTRLESHAEDDEALLNSPRLSMLSESSFPSIYSPKKLSTQDRYAWEGTDDDNAIPLYEPSPHLRQDSIKRVSQWMDERSEHEVTHSKSSKLRTPLEREAGDDLHTSPTIISGGDANISQLLETSPGLSKSGKRQQKSTIEPGRPYATQPELFPAKVNKPSAFTGPMHGEPLLPPTPESASTWMLRDSRSSTNGEKGFFDGLISTANGQDAREADIRTAPRQMRGSAELNHAYNHYNQRRHDTGTYHASESVHDADARSDIVRDLSLEYDGFPDGGSIVMGTPSRFLKHGRPSKVKAPTDGYEILPAQPELPLFTRRRTSSEMPVVPRLPGLQRSETSPILYHARPTRSIASALQSSTTSITSPVSYRSGSSSNHTVVQPDDRRGTMSPDLFSIPSHSSTTVVHSARSRTSPSPARTFGQQAGGLLRRMSNTQRDGGSDREVSPLPTLTTAPSSTYVRDAVREVRRPRTSYGSGEKPVEGLSTSVRNRENQRPSVSPRMMTAPAIPVANGDDRRSLDVDRGDYFQRSNGSQRGPQTPQQWCREQTPEGGGLRGAFNRRRGSIKDAVSSVTRLPWR